TPLILKRGWSGRPAPFKSRCVFTIHNLAYQGVFPREAISDLALPSDLFHPDALEFYGQLNLMKAGLVFADKLTTVSPTYAREIVQSPETGAGLEGLLRHREQDLVGIMNGVDYSRWNPEVDPALPQRYSATEPCGPNQLYSLRYGTLPLVHAVGGLNGSIREGPDGWGFRFDNEDLEGLLAAVERALALWSDRNAWRAAMLRAMARDHSWGRAA